MGKEFRIPGKDNRTPNSMGGFRTLEEVSRWLERGGGGATGWNLVYESLQPFRRNVAKRTVVGRGGPRGMKG